MVQENILTYPVQSVYVSIGCSSSAHSLQAVPDDVQSDARIDACILV